MLNDEILRPKLDFSSKKGEKPWLLSLFLLYLHQI